MTQDTTTGIAIPEDVMEAADNIANCTTLTGIGKDVLSGSIARAIMAERERCAQIAYTFGRDHSRDYGMAGHSIARRILFTNTENPQ